MMAGAEGERRLDLNPDAICRNAPTVMRAVHGKPAGLDWLKLGEAGGYPVSLGDLLKDQLRCVLGARQLTHRQAHRVLVGCFLVMDLQVPAPVGAFERGSCRLVETLGKRVGEALGGCLVADEPGEGRL